MAIRSLFVKILACVIIILLLVAAAANLATRLLGIPVDDPQNVAFVVRVGAALVVVIALCLWLARHITLPVARIGAASQQIATGALSTRVADVFGSRRDELGQLGRDFDLMAAQIETLMASQRRLIRDVSHELRSPLARLSIAVGLARRDASLGTQAQLDRIEQEADQLNRLIGQLLALARLDTGVEPSQQTVFDLSIVIDEIAADSDFEARATGRGVRIVASEQCLIRGLPELMRSAVENVVRNGIRHTPQGANVDIALRVSGHDGDERADISVRDYGVGVPDELLSRLFEPFYRVPGSSIGAGAGLGLAITQRAVQIHGGSITAINAMGGGLAVMMSIPIAHGDVRTNASQQDRRIERQP